jgi:hypothetical protein
VYPKRKRRTRELTLLQRSDETRYYDPRGEECVKPLRWTSHALQALTDRAIDRAEVEQTIASPELAVINPPRRVVLMRRYFDVHLQRHMLLRVVVEETDVELVIVTVYKTSQIAKYLGILP